MCAIAEQTAKPVGLAILVEPAAQAFVRCAARVMFVRLRTIGVRVRRARNVALPARCDSRLRSVAQRVGRLLGEMLSGYDHSHSSVICAAERDLARWRARVFELARTFFLRRERARPARRAGAKPAKTCGSRAGGTVEHGTALVSVAFAWTRIAAARRARASSVCSNVGRSDGP